MLEIIKIMRTIWWVPFQVNWREKKNKQLLEEEKVAMLKARLVVMSILKMVFEKKNVNVKAGGKIYLLSDAIDYQNPQVEDLVMGDGLDNVMESESLCGEVTL